jgi:hypothetical protein
MITGLWQSLTLTFDPSLQQSYHPSNCITETRHSTTLLCNTTYKGHSTGLVQFTFTACARTFSD